MRAPWESVATQSWFAMCRHGGGSSSTSSVSRQQTSNQDNRAAVGGAGIAATNGAQVDATVINQSTDPSVILAALASQETVANNAVGTVAGTVNDLAQTALHENATLSQDAIDQWAATVQNEIGATASLQQQALGIASGEQSITQQALDQIAPLQSTLKIIVYGGVVVAVVYFLAKGR